MCLWIISTAAVLALNADCEPRGKLYDYKPQALKEKMEQSEEMREFIEMCFDPQAPVNKRLKEALLRIMTEEANEE